MVVWTSSELINTRISLEASRRISLEAFRASQWKLKTSAILMLFASKILISKPGVCMNLISYFPPLSKCSVLDTHCYHKPQQMTLSDHSLMHQTWRSYSSISHSWHLEGWGPKGIFPSQSSVIVTRRRVSWSITWKKWSLCGPQNTSCRISERFFTGKKLRLRARILWSSGKNGLWYMNRNSQKIFSLFPNLQY